MFKTNVGGADRILRIAVGAALILWFFLDNGSGFWHWAVAKSQRSANWQPLGRLSGSGVEPRMALMSWFLPRPRTGTEASSARV